MRVATAVISTLWFVAPPFVIATIIAGLASGAAALSSEGRAIWRQVLLATALLSNFATALGVFVGMTGNSLASTVVGALSTLTTTYLAVITGKQVPNGGVIFAPALCCFYFILPFTVLYWRFYSAGGF